MSLSCHRIPHCRYDRDYEKTVDLENGCFLLLLVLCTPHSGYRMWLFRVLHNNTKSDIHNLAMRRWTLCVSTWRWWFSHMSLWCIIWHQIILIYTAYLSTDIPCLRTTHSAIIQSCDVAEWIVLATGPWSFDTDLSIWQLVCIYDGCSILKSCGHHLQPPLLTSHK